MLNRSTCAAARLAFVLCCLVLPAGSLLAQNENETVGFQSNHIFESGKFGEDIDILNGGLQLTIPIGQRYEVNQNLGYQLFIAYNSKIWDIEQWDGKPGLLRRGPMGLGNVMHFGRIYKDVTYVIETARGSTNDIYHCTWYFVTPDGNEHELPSGPNSKYLAGADLTCQNFPTGNFTIDGTFYKFDYQTGTTHPLSTWDGTGAPPVPTITSPDGIRYTFGQYVEVKFGPSPYNIRYSATPTNMRYNTYNKDFGGWYVTKIEDTRTNYAAITDPASPRYGDRDYYAWVAITYGMGNGYQHVIESISDSADRSISFINDCARDGNGNCYESAFPETSPIRTSVRTKAIILPAFNGTTARYDFDYEYGEVWFDNGGQLATESINLLTAIHYPAFCKHTDPAPTPPSTCPERYAMTFQYRALEHGKTGEIERRTLPTQGSVSYGWSNYCYLAAGGRRGYNVSGCTQALISKTVTVSGSPDAHWYYTRQATAQSNPPAVTVKDPLNNETVYYYRASQRDFNGELGYYPEDGWAPEWDDGVNYRIEYYQGSDTNRKLVRSEMRDYDADVNLSLGQRDKSNVRTSRAVTIYNDDGGRQSAVAYSDWDGDGHWRMVAETGRDIEGTRFTRTEYLGTDPQRFLFREVTDGRTVLERTDNHWGSLDFAGGTVTDFSVQKAAPPARLGTGAVSNPPAVVNDIKTTYTRNSYGNVVLKEITDQGDGGAVRYRIQYAWQAGGYLASKTFYDFVNNRYFDVATAQYVGWKAIDRTRDSNTGLISQSRDTGGVTTAYEYDALGRITDILPPQPEHPTQIEYVNVKRAVVRQGDPALMGADFSCGNVAGDYIMTCYDYDDLGRLTRTQKRTYDPSLGPAEQSTRYDALGRRTFESEWLWSTQTTCGATGKPLSECGTRYDYRDPATANPADWTVGEFDPFGRVRRIIPVDGNVSTGDKVTRTDYFGQNSKVTVQGIQGTAGPITAITTYLRDAWGRLINVKSPPGGGADAMYAYDLRNNLVQADLLKKSNLRSQTRLFEYDALNRLRSSWNPESGAEEIAGYDPLGNVTDKVDASGNHLLYTYDGAGRLTKIERRAYQRPNAPTPTTRRLLVNSYDQTDGVGAYGFSGGKLTTEDDYDDLEVLILSKKFYYTGLNGRLGSQPNTFVGWAGGTATLGYGYNNFGLLSSQAYPEGAASKGGAFSVNYLYANGFPTRVYDSLNQTSFASATYNPAGGFQEVATTGYTKTRITTDVRNRPATIDITQTNPFTGAITSYFGSGTYAYDGAGNIFAIGQNAYKYDATNRLAQAEVYAEGGYYKQIFTYDDYGNITDRYKLQLVSGTTTETQEMFRVTDETTELGDPAAQSNRNRILGHTVGVTEALFSYDPRGNLTLGDNQSYDYDSRDRMVAAWLSAGNREIARYSFDAGSGRVRKEDIGGSLLTYYVRDAQGQLMSEFRRTAKGTYAPEWSKHYLYLGSRLVALRENQIPSPVGRLSATTAAGRVTLSWRANPAEEAVTSYKVYRSPNQSTPSWTLLTTTSQTTFNDTTVSNGAWYQYAVSAWKNATVGEGYGSDTLVVQAADSAAPAVPTGLAATPGDKRIDLFWNANVDAIVGYHVYRTIVGVTSQITTVPLTATSLADLNLDNATTYTYAVSAVDSAGVQSAPSPGVSMAPGDHTPPGQPIGLDAQADCTGAAKITVSWFQYVEHNNLDPTKDVQYLLYRNPDFSTPPPPTSDTTFTDQDVSVGMTYEYWVVAQDTNSNRSVPSLKVRATPRNVSSAVPVPATPGVRSGDGKVELRIAWPEGVIPPASVLVYRKLNVDVSCDNYVFLGALSTARPDFDNHESVRMRYIDFVDGGVTNGAAYDYVLTYVGASGQESYYSATALGIPVGRPLGYSECVEDLHTTALAGWKDGAKSCFADGPLTRLNIRWQRPDARPYQPFTATNADGTLAYLKGYHIYRHDLPGTTPTSNDYSTLAPQTIDYEKSFCSGHPGVPCCPWWNCPPCPQGEACQAQAVTPTDPFVTLYRDDGINTYQEQGINALGGDCFAAKAVHKVFANGNWLTVESDFSDNFDVTRRSTPGTRCLTPTLDTCVPTESFCPSPGSVVPPPPTPAKPSVTSAAVGEVTVSWPPAAGGVCQLSSTIDCSYRCSSPGCIYCPDTTTQVCEVCPPGEYCPSGTKSKCVLRTPSDCNPTVENSCPTGQTCSPRDFQGYYLYAMEKNSSVNKYHFTHASPFIAVDKSTACPTDASKICYTFSGLSPYFGDAVSNEFSFQVSAFDQTGRVSEPSPPSDRIIPTGSLVTVPAPLSVKTIIWTVNDAIGTSNPRDLDGIKVSWRPGKATYGGFLGYRVWRSNTRGGPYCALVNQGWTGLNICPGARNASTTAPVTTADTLWLDKTVNPGETYYFVVTVVTSTDDESLFSPEVWGMALGHASPPLSPPAYLKATAARDSASNLVHGIFLRWCQNPPQEGVTSYKIYRGQQPKGPYKFLAEIPLACLDGSHRCEISTVGVTPTPSTTCTSGISGTCRVVDLTVADPVWNLVTDVNDYTYSYVVTAVRNPGGGEPVQESGFSMENQGWPSYCNGSSCTQRYDPDDFPDISCGDEQAALGHPPLNIAAAGAIGESPEAAAPAELTDPLAPYRTVGQSDTALPPPDDEFFPPLAAGPIPCGDCGGGGGTPSPGPIQPNANPRMLYFHLDHLGSPRVITDVNGTPISKHNYMPFGDELPLQAQNSTSTRQFTGHERDSESGLDYMMARYYSSSLGRFLAVDPSRRSVSLAGPQTWNRYTYALNNPLKFVDPNGEDIAIATDGNSRAVRNMLINTAMRPSGRAALQAQASDRSFTTTYRDSRLNTTAAVNQAIHSGGTASLTFGSTNSVRSVTPQGDVIRTSGAEVSVDTYAISKAHPDRSGVTTVGHETYHAEDLRQQCTDADVALGDSPTSATGPAEAFGASISDEEPDISRSEAEALVNGWTVSMGGRSGGVSGGPGYVDSNGTHWSSSRSVEAH